MQLLVYFVPIDIRASLCQCVYPHWQNIWNLWKTSAELVYGTNIPSFSLIRNNSWIHWFNCQQGYFRWLVKIKSTYTHTRMITKTKSNFVKHTMEFYRSSKHTSMFKHKSIFLKCIHIEHQLQVQLNSYLDFILFAEIKRVRDRGAMLNVSFNSLNSFDMFIVIVWFPCIVFGRLSFESIKFHVFVWQNWYDQCDWNHLSIWNLSRIWKSTFCNFMMWKMYRNMVNFNFR